MKRIWGHVVFATAAICGPVSFAMVYGWNDAKRPPISLADALIRAEELLGDDAAIRYCVGAWLHGDATGEGKDGAWSLKYAAADGSKKHVFIQMNGDGNVAFWNGPVDWSKNNGRRHGLDDVRRRLDEFFIKEHIDAEQVLEDGTLTVKHHTRTFSVHPENDSGGFDQRLREAPGPKADGIWLRVRLVDQPDLREYGYDNDIYWRWLRGTYLTTEPGKFLAVDMRYGRKLKVEHLHQLLQILGEPQPP